MKKYVIIELKIILKTAIPTMFIPARNEQRRSMFLTLWFEFRLKTSITIKSIFVVE